LSFLWYNTTNILFSHSLSVLYSVEPDDAHSCRANRRCPVSHLHSPTSSLHWSLYAASGRSHPQLGGSRVCAD